MIKKQEIQNIIDRVVGTKGALHIPAWWMNKILSDIIELSIENKGDILDVEKQLNLTEKELTTKIDNVETELKNLTNDILVNVTYSELKSLRDNSQLIPGQQYRITDYETITNQVNTKSAGHQFDIIVTADDINVLNENARAIQHDGDNYFSNSDLNAWELKYCLDNDIDRFDWADTNEEDIIVLPVSDNMRNFIKSYGSSIKVPNTLICKWWDNPRNGSDGLGFDVYIVTNMKLFADDFMHIVCPCGSIPQSGVAFPKSITTSDGYSIPGNAIYLNGQPTECIIDSIPTVFESSKGKGVIYYMKDEFNNECPYDFKNIQFARWELSNPVGYRNDYDADNYEDNWIQDSTPFDSLKNGFYGKHYSNNVFYYGFNSTYSMYKVEYTISESPTYCYTFGKDTDYSINGSNYGNVIKEYKNVNKIQLNNIVFLGDACYSNSLGIDCYSNSFGANCNSNSLGANCNSNSLGNGCNSNSFGANCNYNSFGANCNSNSFGANCYSNSLGIDCYSNSLGNGCYSNSLGNGCGSNSLGNSCTGNTFGNNCQSNSLGNGCGSNSLGNSCTGNTFGNNCNSNTFGIFCKFNSFSINCYGNTFSDECNSNSLGDSCDSNTLDIECVSNSFGKDCTGNTFGNNCNSNSLGAKCNYNSFGNFCYGNIFGTYCYSNSLGNGCNSNSFGDECSSNSFGESHDNPKSFYRYIIFDNGNSYINLNCTSTTSILKYYQNVRIGLGVNNTTTYKTINDSNVGQTFETVYKPEEWQLITV